MFQAIQTPIDRTVALKTLHLSHAGNKLMVAQFLFNEAKTLGKLQHPNVVQVIDYGRTASAGVAYLVMEFLRGETLSKRLKIAKPRRSAFRSYQSYSSGSRWRMPWRALTLTALFTAISSRTT